VLVVVTLLALAGAWWVAPGLLVVVEMAVLGLLAAVLSVACGITPLAELRALVSSRKSA
jgi:hypothetical protein